VQKTDQSDRKDESLTPMPPEVDRFLRALLASAERLMAEEEGNGNNER
jgi:hypothetical protein